MLTVTQLANGELSVKSHYIYKDRIKKIFGAFFNNSTKTWIIPSYSLGALEAEFPDEIFYKTPRWVIMKQPMPDMSAMYHIDDQSIQAPQLKLKPYDYQKYGIRFMIDKLIKHNMVLNCDSVGTGKTIQAIGTMLWFIQNRGIKKILIVCKKSIKKQWSDEFDKFTDLRKQGFKIIWTDSNAAKRRKAFKEYDTADKAIIITNYHSFLNDSNIIGNTHPEFVVIDEAHVVKAKDGKLNNNITRVCNGLPVIFLTGTPIMSRPEDIFGIIQIASYGYFGSWNDFVKQFLVYVHTNFGMECAGAKNLSVLRSKIQDLLIQRTEFEVSVELPKVNIITQYCQMDSVQEQIICAINDEQTDIINKTSELKRKLTMLGQNVENNPAIQKLEAQSKGLIAARQAAVTDPRMFTMSNSEAMRKKYSPLIPSSYKMSSKMENILELVETIIDSGNKVIIFSKFRTSALLAMQDIQKHLKYKVLLYTGTENDYTRAQNIELFTNTSDYNIIIGTDAMAEGWTKGLALLKHHELRGRLRLPA